MRFKNPNKRGKKQFPSILLLAAFITLLIFILISTTGCPLETHGLFEGEFDEETAPPPDGCVGEYYAYDLHSAINLRGTRSPVTFEITGNIPDGLTLDPDTGILSGVPTRVDNYTFEVTARNSSDVDPIANLTIRIQNFSITTDYLPPACSGAGYSTIITICGGTGDFLYQITDPPPFLTLGVTGETPSRHNTLTGVPPTAGTYDFTLRVTDSTGHEDSKSFILIVSNDKRIITPQNLPIGVEGMPYDSYSLQACGGTPPYTWTCPTHLLPVGMTLSEGGVLRGTPDVGTAGTYTLSVRLRDNDDSETEGIIKSFNLTVAGTPLTVSPITPSLTECSEITSAPIARASGGMGERFWEVLNLPPEIEGSARFTPAGDVLNMSWTPQIAGEFTFSVRVRDATPEPAETPVTLVVNEIPGFGIEVVRVFHMESRVDPDNEIYLDENNDEVVDSSDHRFKIRFRVTDGACAAAVGSGDDIFSAGTTSLKIIGFCDASIPSATINYEPDERVYLALFEAEHFSGLIELTGGSITEEYRAVRLRIEVDCSALNPDGTPIRYIANTGEVRVFRARPLIP